MEWFAVFAIYSIWAIYSGYKFLNGRVEWLERKEPVNRVCKFLAALCVGYVIGAFYLVWWVIKIALRITDGF